MLGPPLSLCVWILHGVCYLQDVMPRRVTRALLVEFYSVVRKKCLCWVQQAIDDKRYMFVGPVYTVHSGGDMC
jgi:hypothetical protein